MTQLPHSVLVTVRQIKKDVVEFETEDGQKITWPTNKIADVEIGETIELVALSKNDIETERAALAKHVLNYMLTGDEGAL